MYNIKTILSNTKLKKITVDFGYNILSSLISTGTMQIILYPMLALMMGAEVYGALLTTMAIVNTIAMSLGSTLNNTRLIQNIQYKELMINGDYNILLVYANVIGVIILYIVAQLIFKYDKVTLLLLGILIVVSITKSYLNVAYRLQLNYKMNLVSSIITSIGYCLGLFCVKYTKLWPIAFIVAEIFNIIFLIFSSDLFREPLKKTKLFKKTTVKYAMLIITGVISSLLLYLDRLIIYPYLGGEAVTIYTVASFFGKSLGLLMTPVASVLLSYYAQESFKMSIKRFWRINTIILFVSVIFFIVSIFFAPWFTRILYPTVIESARQYLVLANAASILGVTAIMTDPIVLKYAPTYWQIIIYLIYLCAYLVASLLFMSKFGLLGLCIAIIFANSIKLCLLYIVGSYFIIKVDS